MPPIYLSNSHWQLLCPDHICLLTSVVPAACIRCGYISLKLSTSALERIPIFTSFNLTLVIAREKIMLQEPDSLCSISILLSGIKYIIFLKTAFPRFVTKSYMHAHLLTYVHVHTCEHMCAHTPLSTCFPPYRSHSSWPGNMASMSSILLYN